MEDKIKELGLLLGKANKLFEEIQNPAEIKFEIGKWLVIELSPENKEKYPHFKNALIIYAGKGADQNHIGFNFVGRWVNDFGNMWQEEANHSVRLATEEEIKQALIAEASRRGFKKGVNIMGDSFLGSTNPYKLKIADDFEYRPYEDSLGVLGGHEDGCYAKLYQQGKWAEIVTAPQLTFGGNPVTIDGNKITCKGVTGTYEQLKRIYDELVNPAEYAFGSAKLEGYKLDNGEGWQYELNRTSQVKEVKIGCSWGTIEEIKAILTACENQTPKD